MTATVSDATHDAHRRQVLIEACVDSLRSADAAARGGAGRLELCDALFDGGTTPSAGMIGAVRDRVSLPLFVIIRPRGGDFTYTDDERLVMLRDIRVARELGVDGVVIGALSRDGSVDTTSVRALVDAAGPMSVTFHRAFDLIADQRRAVDELERCGVQRILTSGGSPAAIDGAARIRDLVDHAAGRLIVMAGGGIRESQVPDLVLRSGVTELHVRGTRLAHGSTRVGRQIPLRKALPTDEYAWDETDESRIREFVRLANQ